MKLSTESARLIKISRPLTWIFGPLLFGYPFISHPGMSIYAALHLLLMSFPLSFMLFGINDIYDQKSDQLNERKRHLVHGVVLKKREFGKVKVLSGIFGASIIAVGAASQNILTLVLSISLVVAGYAYSAPPIRLKERPPLDSISNAVIIYLITALGFSHLVKGTLLPQLSAAWPFLVAIISIHMFSTITDHDPDQAAGVKTSATVFGKTRTATAALILMAFSLLNTGSSDIFIRGYLALCLVTITLYFISEKTTKTASIAHAIGFVFCAIGSIAIKIL